jgi:(1->4)-alpha-D-glucan 1-alpha-D-glucosylmutase
VSTDLRATYRVQFHAGFGLADAALDEVVAEVNSDVDRLDALLERIDDGLPKLWVIRQTLKLRRERRLFALDAITTRSLAPGQSPVTLWLLRAEIAPSRSCPGSWSSSAAPGKIRQSNCPVVVGHAFTEEIFNGGELRIANLFKHFPVALLSREDGS